MLQSANESQRVEDLERELSHSPSFDIDVWSDLFLLLCEFANLLPVVHRSLQITCFSWIGI
mgnify:CR=1 FL=1